MEKDIALSSMQYPDQTIKRAKRAVRCTPFQVQLFAAMRLRSVSLQEISGRSGVQQGYTRQPLAELVAENALLWLIQVGVLRREVDGQGITDSFRLTPLGRQLVEQWQNQDWHSPSLQDKARNAFSRWLRLPA